MDLQALAARYEAINSDDEAKILREIFAAGWEAGCWLRVADDELIKNSRAEIDAFYATLSDRDDLFMEFGDDPNPHGLPQHTIEGTDDCYIVIAQRCDIIAPFRGEPLVEIAPARHVTNKEDINNKWRTSPREFPVDPGANETHMVDIRQHYWIPKIALLDLEARQSLPANTQPHLVRHRVALRLGQRYTRTALPDKLVPIFRELRKILQKDKNVDRLFSEWMIYHGERWPEDRPFLVGVYFVPDLSDIPEEFRSMAEQQFRVAAEDMFERIIERLVEELPEAEKLVNLDEAPSGAISFSELPHAMWHSSWKLDLDALTFGGKTEGALPDR